MAASERFTRTTPDCDGGSLDRTGHCLRASFSCPDHHCPEMNGLLMRLFSPAPPAADPPRYVDVPN